MHDPNIVVMIGLLTVPSVLIVPLIVILHEVSRYLADHSEGKGNE